MTRLIDADALHTLFDEKCQRKCASCPYWTNCNGHLYCELIDIAPTVEERPQGEWVGINEYLKHIEETTGEKYKTSGIYNGRLFCNKCWEMSELMIKTNFCYECGAEMKETENE